MVLRSYALMVLWSYGLMVLWSYGLMLLWSYGLMLLWSYGLMLLWSYGLTVFSQLAFIALTGFVIAAFRDWKLTVSNAITMTNSPEAANIHQLNSIR